MTTTRRLASARVTQRGVPVVAALLLAATSACASEPAPAPEYAGICVDPVTQNRIDDDYCGDPDDDGYATGGGGYFFLWMSTSSYQGHVPAVGQRAPVTAGARTVPRGRAWATGVPKAGGSMPAVVRGGLGVSAGGKGGGS